MAPSPDHARPRLGFPAIRQVPELPYPRYCSKTLPRYQVCACVIVELEMNYTQQNDASARNRYVTV